MSISAPLRRFPVTIGLALALIGLCWQRLAEAPGDSIPAARYDTASVNAALEPAGRGTSRGTRLRQRLKEPSTRQ